MFRAHKGKRLRDVLVADQRVAVRMLKGRDFHEGVRAMLIDKTKDAKWSPAALKDVSAAVRRRRRRPRGLCVWLPLRAVVAARCES